MQHRRQRHLRNIVSHGIYATSSTAALTKQQRPRYLRNIVGRGIYATSFAAALMQHVLRNKKWATKIGLELAGLQCKIVGGGIYGTSSATASTQHRQLWHLRNNNGRRIYATSLVAEYITSFSTASTQHALRNKNWAGKIGLELAAARLVGLGNRLSILKFVLVARYNDTIKSKMNFLSIINLSFFLIHVHIKYSRSIFL